MRGGGHATFVDFSEILIFGGGMLRGSYNNRICMLFFGFLVVKRKNREKKRKNKNTKNGREKKVRKQEENNEIYEPLGNVEFSGKLCSEGI